MNIEIIPAMDLIDGARVRLAQGDYDRRTTYGRDPLDTALRFEAAGLRRLHMVDLDGARAQRPANLKVLERIAARTRLEIQYGGGIKSRTALCDVFSAGARRAVCGSVAVREPDCLAAWLAEFGAFCDIGCGIAALLPIDCLSVSRIASPADRVQVGQQLLCAIKNRDAQGRIVLTLRELLGTWSENAACFAAGETVVGIVRSVEDYGVFIEIAPNLAGLAEADSTLRPGQAVSVYIKNILPDKMKIKLVVVNKNLNQPLRFEPHYFVTRGRLKRWTYSTPQSRKQIETVF